MRSVSITEIYRPKTPGQRFLQPEITTAEDAALTADLRFPSRERLYQDRVLLTQTLPLGAGNFPSDLALGKIQPETEDKKHCLKTLPPFPARLPARSRATACLAEPP